MDGFFPTAPQINIPKEQSAYQYQSKIPQSSPIKSLLDSIGEYLKPQQAYSTINPYETYAAPQRATFRQWEQQFARPEFDRFTMNPFEEQYKNQMAAGGGFRMGNAPEVYGRTKAQVEQPYFNQIEQARQSYEDMIRQFYNQELQQYYNSPTTFNKIGL